MDPEALLQRLTKAKFYAGQIAHRRAVPERAADLSEAEWEGYRLYSHQAEAISHLRAGRNVVVVTGTASGKTLCYRIPVLEACEEDPLATALLLFPTKALTQDQLRGFEGTGVFAGAYDGDTPTDLRRKLRDRGRVILTNPDMLHSGILPNHARWSRFFAHLKYVVVDEVHAYRGVFGSHLANVMRRLLRICAHHGSAPRFVACSATIANPGGHAERVLGAPVTVVDEDGSPRGPKTFVLWNGEGKSPLWEAVHLFAALVKEGIQTITFTRTRLTAELVAKNARDLLTPVSRKLASRIHAYRGGYLPEERREIERRLAERDLLGVASTNALELGIDVGSLDACVILGYPGTVASLWQQAGRAGRKQDDSLVFLVGRNNPVDQFLMSQPDWLFGRSPERAVVDPDNPHVAVGHVRCAAHELPVDDAEGDLFGPLTGPLLSLLEEEQAVRRIDGRWFFASSEYPASDVNLRNIAGPVYTIQDVESGRVIGTLDELGALNQLHDHAVYLHGGESWFVNRLDLAQKIALVERRDLDYYTRAVQASTIRIDEVEEREEWRGGALGFGDVTVTTTLPMFKKVRYHSRESVGFERLELPPSVLETTAMWFTPPELPPGTEPGQALAGLGNVLVEVVPVHLMCEPSDIGAVVDVEAAGRPTLFLHDRLPGGMGYAQGARERFAEILDAVAEVIRSCPCDAGCPSCVGAADAPFVTTDLETAGQIPDKAAALELLEALEVSRTPAPSLPCIV